MDTITPAQLGLHKTLEMVNAPQGKTFYYRNERKRVIEHGWFDAYWLDRVTGPTIYAVTDHAGTIRYFGKHAAETPIRSRWFRHGFIHHQKSSRNRFIAELDAGRGPLQLWSVPVRALRSRLPEQSSGLSDTVLVAELESLWVARWRGQLWNKVVPPRCATFHDGEYWRG